MSDRAGMGAGIAQMRTGRKQENGKICMDNHSVLNPCKLSTVADLVIGDVYDNRLHNALLRSMRLLSRGLEHSGVGAEEGIMRDHPLSPQPKLGKHHRLNDIQWSSNTPALIRTQGG